MKKVIFLIFILTLMATGCRLDAQTNNPSDNGESSELTIQTSPDSSVNTPSSNDSQKELDSLPTEETAETLGPDCYGNDIHPIGQSIAELYIDQTDYTEVMVWFCNGFEFEDIVTALQTEEDTDYTAEELLTAIEYGLSWEEIWVEIDYIEE